MSRCLWVVLLALVACGAPLTPAGDPPPDARSASDGPHPDAETGGFTVQYADPDHGPFGGGTQITVRGFGFAEGDWLSVGGRLAPEVTIIDSRRILAVTPPGEPGLADLEVRHENGEVAVAAGAFRFDALDIQPPSGSTAGGTFVTITGYGTDFAAGTIATLDGLPLTSITILDAERLTGYTPPGTVGDAELRVTTATSVHDVERAYRYSTTGDPFAGGMSGGPIDGSLDVVILDSWTRNGLPGAFVSVGDPATTAYRGTTDALGQITFSGPDLVGPVTVTATAAGFEVATFHCFDAEHLTIWLRSPLPPPQPGGPPGVGPGTGTIHGHVVFGDVTGQGTPYWDLVPEPRTPTETKRIYVTTSSSSIFSSPRPPIAPIDYAYDPDTVSWAFEVESRPGAYAVVAVAGLYDETTQDFEPFALGITRGVLVGPEETVENVDVVVSVPLDAAAHVQLEDAPPLGTPGQLGPSAYTLKAFVDLGSDGAIAFGRHGVPYEPPQLPPGTYAFPPGADDLAIGAAPPRFGPIGNASYSMIAVADTGGGSPLSGRIVRGMPALGAVTIGDFLGTPHAVDPPRDGVASGRRVVFAPDGSDRTPTFHEHLLSTMDGTPVWRGITCGELRDVELPDLSSAGFDWPPTGEQLVWTMWAVDIAGGGAYDAFTYRWLGATYWDAYADDAVYVQFPQ
jgi:hypothetical protein